MKSGYITCSDAKIYYEVHGDGEPLVFLHGNGEEMGYFSPQIKAFSKEYKVVLIDSRGHGKSSYGKRKLSLDLMSNDVVKVLNELELDNVNLVGFSDGGNIALNIALIVPEILKTITIIGANLKPKDLIIKERIAIFFEHMLTFNKKKREILDLMIHEPNMSTESLKKINIPALVVAGERDAIKEKSTRLIANSIRGSELQIVKNSDHFLTSNNSEVFNTILIEFIRSYQ
ncbi:MULTISPECIES: alpha/beta hydrolase [Clostridium]|uniref:Alpha/beta hydrolase n=1 Tax=Clostridium cibarium TaxID=2762247 RepID=A0ABR8PUV0_9CLOT|nr:MULTISPECIES: alpha/beta hydrolase [Clostridium]MBD7911942.1 alpha/beta hydrolase [Clostridium cibarium]